MNKISRIKHSSLNNCPNTKKNFSPPLPPYLFPPSLQTREDTHDGKIFASIVSRLWKFFSQGKRGGVVVYSSMRFLRFRFFSFVRTDTTEVRAAIRATATLVIEFASFSRDRTISSSSFASSSFTLFFVERKLDTWKNVFLPLVQLVGNIGP